MVDDRIVKLGFLLPSALISVFVATPVLAQSSELQTAGAFATVLTTLNAGFFAQGSAVTTVPGDAQPNQFGKGVWVRGNAGLFDIKSTASVPGSPSSQINARSTFAGVQAGVDLGNFNISGTGFNVVYGATGGQVNVVGSASGVSGSANYSIPFVGAYVVASKDGFVAEASYRHDFYSASLTDSGFGLLNTPVEAGSNTEAVSLAYKYRLPMAFFVEPSAAFSYSRLSTDSFFVSPPVPPSGTFQANPINSDLGRVGLRVGKAFSVSGIVVEPFVAASVWHEFADPNSATVTPVPAVPGAIPVSGTVTRVGTFGQYSLGFSSVITGGLLIFARGDLRSGSSLTGNTITGGMRYSF